MPDEVSDNGHDASSPAAASVTVNGLVQRCCITVEPALLFSTFATALSSSLLTQLLLIRSCEVILGYDSDKCNLLVNQTDSKEAHDIEDLVQPHVTVLQMYKSIIDACVPLVLSLFIGAWSDIHGRKPLMMWPLFGYGLHFAVLAVLSTVNHLSPGYFLLASIPLACCGGFITIVTGVYSYISDVTSTEKRAFRMGLLDGSIYTGYAIGMLCTAPLFNVSGKYGYLIVFSVSSVLNLLGFLYLVFVPESVNINQTDESSHAGVCSIFDFKLVVRMISTCCKKREHYGRPIIFLMIIAISSCILILEGESAVTFLYTRTKFGWNLSKYMNYSSFTVLVTVIGSTAGMYIFSVWLNLSDSIFAVFVFIIKTVQILLFAFAPTPWYLIACSIIGAIGAVIGPLCRSVLSKSVPQSDIGAVFALTSMVEAVAPFVSAPIYNLVYNATFLTFPGTVFLMTAGLYIVDIILVAIVVMLQHISSRQYSLFVNEEH